MPPIRTKKVEPPEPEEILLKEIPTLADITFAPAWLTKDHPGAKARYERDPNHFEEALVNAWMRKFGVCANCEIDLKQHGKLSERPNIVPIYDDDAESHRLEDLTILCGRCADQK